MRTDLISRAALLERFEGLKNNPNNSFRDMLFLNGAMSVIDNVPAVDAEPVRRGRWIPEKVDAAKTEFKCSECDRTVVRANDYFGKPTKHASSTFPYCHCGAKMDGDSNG